jgi:nucleoside-diphosphate-sugar epimerase
VSDSLAGRRVLVTGGHGFIGAHVVRALAAAGADPVATLHPGGDPAPGLVGSSLVVDLEVPGAVADAVEGCDLVVHLAARAGGIQFQLEGALDVFTANRSITDNLLRAAAGHGVGRMFLASSLVIYRTSPTPFDEDHELLAPADRPSPYAWSKITDEVVAAWHEDVETVAGRFGNVYGPGAPFDEDRSTVVHALIDRAARLGDGAELEVWGDGTAVRSFVFVEDVADAVVRILGSGLPGAAYNVDSAEAVTIAELAGIVVDEVNPTLRLRFDPSKPSGPPVRVASIERLRGLGFEPSVDLAEGLRRTVEWYRSQS